MSEYLKGFRTERIKDVTPALMLERGLVIAPHSLSRELEDAKHHLITEPGPHLGERRKYATGWLSWWISFLDGLPSSEALLTPSPKLIPFIALPHPEESTGVLFVAGAEGHEGHRFASFWMKKHVAQTLWMFEEDIYMAQKVRQEPYLPLEVRLSMWAHHPHIDYLSVTPFHLREKFPDLNHFYQHVFDITGADYCFATEDDPHEDIKRARGKAAAFTRIPSIPVPRTTERVARLLPAEQDEDEETIYDRLYALSYMAFPWDAYQEFRRHDEQKM